jgi:hypothetical protein
MAPPCAEKMLLIAGIGFKDIVLPFPFIKIRLGWQVLKLLILHKLIFYELTYLRFFDIQE